MGRNLESNQIELLKGESVTLFEQDDLITIKGQNFVRSGAILESENGKNWLIPRNMPLFPSLTSMVQNGATIVATHSVANSCVLVSLDYGKNWEFVRVNGLQGSSTVTRVCFSGTRYYATSNGNTYTAQSLDGISWSNAAGSMGSGSTITTISSLSANGDTIIYTNPTSTATPQITYSINRGLTVAAAVLPDTVTAVMTSSIYANGMFVVVGYSTEWLIIHKSTDGIVWTTTKLHVLPIFAAGGLFISFANGVFAISQRANSTNIMMFSTDLISWETKSINNINITYLATTGALLFLDNKYFIMTNQGLLYSYDLVSFNKILSFTPNVGVEYFIDEDGNLLIATSTAGTFSIYNKNKKYIGYPAGFMAGASTNVYIKID